MNELDHTAAQSPLAHVDTWEALAIDYLDGTLSGRDLARVQAHLDACSECRDAVLAQREVMALTKDVPLVRVPSELSERILQALGGNQSAVPQAANKKHPSKLQRGFWERFVHAPWAPAAVALVVVAVGIAAWSGIRAEILSREQGLDGTTAAARVETTVTAGGAPSAATLSATEASDTSDSPEYQGASTTTASPATTAAATTTSVALVTGTSQKVTTSLTVATSSLSTRKTAVSTSTTAAAGAGLVAALGLTPVFLTLSPTGTSPADADALIVLAASAIHELPRELWLNLATYAAVMSDSEMAAFRDGLRQAGFDSAVDLPLPYDTGYLDAVAHALGLSVGHPGGDNLLILTLRGRVIAAA